MDEQVEFAANGNAGAVERFSGTGFKSLFQRVDVPLGPLTLLAGANSSGKSSAIQPLLLLKQTLEATFDPGPLLIDGPNVKFSRASQMFWSGPGAYGPDRFIEFRLQGDGGEIELLFQLQAGGVALRETRFRHAGKRRVVLREGMAAQELNALLDLLPPTPDDSGPRPVDDLRVIRSRCEHKVVVTRSTASHPLSLEYRPLLPLESSILALIHVPAIRGNPERTYKRTAVGAGRYPGLFNDYVASIVAAWHETGDPRTQRVSKALARLGLTWRIVPRAVDDVRIALQVSRYVQFSRPGDGPGDMVDIADVGFGVSQVLPIVVALEAAEPNQIVYVEQPEVHLHPRAQIALAQLFADAVQRGVRVVAETHSDLLLLAVQSLVAEGKLAPEAVNLLWFQRDSVGATTVARADLDEHGAFGEWPTDFADVRLELERRYLDAGLRP